MKHRIKPPHVKRISERHRVLAKARPPKRAPGQEKI
jgi:hypothetical protein